jgi:anaerobic selenocysteine-containing dehydrogenase
MDRAQEKRGRFAALVSGNLASVARGAACAGAIVGEQARAVPPSASALMEATRRAADAEGLEIIPTCCFSCNTACEVLAFRDRSTGRIVKIEGDPSSPVTRGAACAKGLAAADLLYNPARLKKPLRRATPRGQGRDEAPAEWREISWDEALGEIAEKLLSCRERDGARSVAFLEGTRRGWSRVFSRLANAFGAPNHGAAGWAQCLWPRLVDCRATFGGAQYPEACDYDNTRCIIVWGANPAATWPLQGSAIMDARERGARLIVIDPRLSETAAKADSWIRIRPGKDTDLALGLIHVIIEENLYDARFVEEWTSGFEELRAHVAGRTPELTERLTGVSADAVRETARTYALSKPSCIFRCVTVDQTIDSVQTCRALSILMAITGNIDIPGGNVLVSSRGERTQNSHDFILAGNLTPEAQKERRGWDRFPLLCGELSSVPSAHMPTLWETIATGEPYPVKAALIFGSNAAVSYTNAERVSQAMGKLEFVAVCDLFMTPTAQMADIVLPASSWLERDNVISSFQTSLEYTVIQQKCASIGESRSDVEIIGDLAERLGVGEFFWKDAEALYDYLLEPTGLTLRQAIAKRRLHAPLTYGRYRKAGFKTPSGKVELYASILEKKGCAPLPQGSVPSAAGAPPAAGVPPADAAYPFLLSSGARSIFFRHTENRRNPWLIAQCPDPVVYINSDTARALGIAENDLVEVATPTGSAWLRARLESGLEANFVEAVPGWEGRGNINRALGWEAFAEGIGTVPMRGLKCAIRKADNG